MSDHNSYPIRLFITIDTSTFPEETSLTTSIVYSRFVYAFDCAQHRTVADVLENLHSTLIPGGNNDELFDHLDLFLGDQNEYFIPPWSNTREVFRHGDAVVLRFRPSTNSNSTRTTAPAVKEHADEGVFGADQSVAAESWNKETKKKKKKEKKKKRKHEALEDEREDAELSSAAGAPDEMTTTRANAGIAAADDEATTGGQSKANKAKKKQSKKRRRLFDPNNVESEGKEDERCGEKPAIPEAEPPGQDPVSAEKRSPLRKKRHRQKGQNSVYDNAKKVIRNGDTGKIQHVYFDSSSASTSPVSEAEPAVANEEDREEEREDAPPPQPRPSSASSRISAADNSRTDKLNSKALAKAKSFTTLISEETNCANLSAKNLQRRKFPTSTPSSADQQMTEQNNNNVVEVVVTTKQPRNPTVVADVNGDSYSNTSYILKKAAAAKSRNSLTTSSETTTTAEQAYVLVHPKPQKNTSLTTSGSTRTTNGQAALNGNAAVECAPVSSHQATNAAFENASIIPDFETYPRVHAAALRKGDRIAYKVMELNELDCTPGVSDWKVGELVDFDFAEMQLRIKLVSGKARCEVPWKFRFIQEDEEEINGEIEQDSGSSHDQDQQRNQEEIIHWNEIIEARLMTK